MNNLMRVGLMAGCGALTVALLGCSPSQSVNDDSSSEPTTLTLAPPGPQELGAASGISAAPEDAVVFDLKYKAKTGAANELSYHSYWGFGGSDQDARNNKFLQQVRKKSPDVHPVNNSDLKGREWGAVEIKGNRASAFYLDLNADGELSENECLPATVKTGQGFEFITPDFMNASGGAETALTRVLLRVDFYGGKEPNCMWSPAAFMEGEATLNEEPVRLLLYADEPGGCFEEYGSSSYSILNRDHRVGPNEYVPRQTLSSLICERGQFYHLRVEGHRTNGLPARVLLVKDSSPIGTLMVRMAGTNAVAATLSSLSLRGVEDRTVFFNMANPSQKMKVPVGAYGLTRGVAAYGGPEAREWEVSFSEGPSAVVKSNETTVVSLGTPELRVRAVEESKRYMSDVSTGSTFKRGTKLYFEPRVVGTGNEVFRRFRQKVPTNSQPQDRPPRITITAQDGKRLLSKSMEYG